jgi:hypothetical protein
MLYSNLYLPRLMTYRQFAILIGGLSLLITHSLVFAQNIHGHAIGKVLPKPPVTAASSPHIYQANQALPSLNLELVSDERLAPAKPIKFKWVLSNASILQTSGILDVKLGTRVVMAYPQFPAVTNLKKDSPMIGEFQISAPTAGTYELTIRFLHPTGQMLNIHLPSGKVESKLEYTSKAEAKASFIVTPAPIDVDQDGIDDALETMLLARHTPYLRFSIDGGPDNYRPTDVLDYIRGSQLQSQRAEGNGVIVPNSILSQNPNALLSHGSDLTSAPPQYRKDDRFLDPVGENPRIGRSWPEVRASRKIGLFGHVVPFRAEPPFTDFLQCWKSKTENNNLNDNGLCGIDINPDAPKHYYKIEYWQFFGFNEKKRVDFGDHEGDWATVQVIVHADTLQIAQIQHYAHGNRIGFDYRFVSSQKGKGWDDFEDGQILIREYRGPNYGETVDFDWHDLPTAKAKQKWAERNAQNNVVQMTRDSVSGEYTHPVVYVENGGHEFWPTKAWTMADAQNHNGDDVENSYLAAPPVNLGEVEHPMAESPAANVVLRYNGRWGAWGGAYAGTGSTGIFTNDPPQGPPLHNGWTWPESSSIRRQLQKDLGN